MKTRLLWLLLPAVTLLLDWVSKFMILGRLQLHESMVVIPSFFNLTLVHNRGAIFGMLSSAPDWLRTTLFSLAGVSALLYFGYEFLREGVPKLQRLALGLILGGALGNGLDRFQHGYVVDFLDFIFWGWHYWTFNVADSCIVSGACLMGIHLLKHRQTMSENSPLRKP